MQPFSRGSVRLSGPDAGAPPIVDPNYFGDDRDLRSMVTALRLARQIGAASAYDPWRLAEAAPGPAADDDQGDEALRNFAKAACQSYFHPVGTCAMGDTDMSVVDSELRVHAISGLRIADASVMPSIPSANTAATVYAIAERAAELIGG
jgi:choline dehydrogenase